MNALDRRTFVKAVGAAVVLGPSVATGTRTVLCNPCRPWKIEGIMVWSGLEETTSHMGYRTFRNTGRHFVSLKGKPSLHVHTQIGCNKTGDGSIEKPFKTWQHAVQIISM